MIIRLKVDYQDENALKSDFHSKIHNNNNILSKYTEKNINYSVERLVFLEIPYYYPN